MSTSSIGIICAPVACTRSGRQHSARRLQLLQRAPAVSEAVLSVLQLPRQRLTALPSLQDGVRVCMCRSERQASRSADTQSFGRRLPKVPAFSHSSLCSHLGRLAVALLSLSLGECKRCHKLLTPLNQLLSGCLQLHPQLLPLTRALLLRMAWHGVHAQHTTNSRAASHHEGTSDTDTR